MPTYEYVCTDCETRIEVVQRMTEDPLTTCGACGGTLRRVFHPAGILFKGSGFYATDNRSKPKAPVKADSAGSASSSSGASETTKADATAKTEPKKVPAKDTKASTGKGTK